MKNMLTKIPAAKDDEAIRERRNERRRAFSHAAREGDTETVLKMLDDKTAELEDHWGAFTALGFAISHHHAEIARILLERGANPNDISSDQHAQTPLTIAGWVGCTEIVDDLIRHGANPFHRSTNGWTPREWAERNSHRDTVAAMKKGEAEYLSYRTKRMRHVVARRKGLSGP